MGHQIGYTELGMLAIIIVFIIYGVFYYRRTWASSSYRANSSYYGADIAEYKPIFKSSFPSLTECTDRCTGDITCAGITYNTATQECIGSDKTAIQRDDAPHLSSWIKPVDAQPVGNIANMVLVGYTDKQTIVPAAKLARPYNQSSFTVACTLLIRNATTGFGMWKHICHKGTPAVPMLKDTGSNKWEHIITAVPEQFFGIWIAPYNNNMRIVFTTIGSASRGSPAIHPAATTAPQTIGTATYLHRDMEFIDGDIGNLLMNQEMNIILNVIGATVEVYINGALLRSKTLGGTPEYNGGDLYIMNATSVDGYVKNMLYYPNYCKLEQIGEIVALNTTTATTT
jgi:hypothetical protein